MQCKLFFTIIIIYNRFIETKKQDSFIAILFQTHIYGKLQFLLKARKIYLLFNEKRSLGRWLEKWMERDSRHRFLH